MTRHTWLILILVAPTVLAGQDLPRLDGGVQLLAATHLAGFVRHYEGDPPSDWAPRLQPTLGVGAHAALALHRSLGVRVDAAVLPRVSLKANPGWTNFSNDHDRLSWAALSAWYRPAFACHSVCGALSAGVGVGSFEFSQTQLSGDIGFRAAPRQSRGVTRVAVELSMPSWAPALSLSISDCAAAVKRGIHGDEGISRLHILVVELGYDLWE